MHDRAAARDAWQATLLQAAGASHATLLYHRQRCVASRLPRDAAAGETEYRELSGAEVAALNRACEPRGCRVKDLPADVVKSLYRKGLIYLEVPISQDDRWGAAGGQAAAGWAVHARGWLPWAAA